MHHHGVRTWNYCRGWTKSPIYVLRHINCCNPICRNVKDEWRNLASCTQISRSRTSLTSIRFLYIPRRSSHEIFNWEGFPFRKSRQNCHRIKAETYSWQSFHPVLRQKPVIDNSCSYFHKHLWIYLFLEIISGEASIPKGISSLFWPANVQCGSNLS